GSPRRRPGPWPWPRKSAACSRRWTRWGAGPARPPPATASSARRSSSSSRKPARSGTGSPPSWPRCKPSGSQTPPRADTAAQQQRWRTAAEQVGRLRQELGGAKARAGELEALRAARDRLAEQVGALQAELELQRARASLTPEKIQEAIWAGGSWPWPEPGLE